MSDLHKFSYCLGVNIGASLQNDGIVDFNVEDLAKGLQHALENTDLLVSPEEAQQILQEGVMKARESKGAEAKLAGEAYLEANAKKEGVTTLPSGLQYEVITEGTGAKPSASDQVVCHYHGTLIDGSVFDSSVMRNEPATFPVNGVIQGWVEALQLMPVGSKWKLTIPHELAYGERGAGADIAPYSALVFEVELLDIK